jgi:hypothetical protein
MIVHMKWQGIVAGCAMLAAPAQLFAHASPVTPASYPGAQTEFVLPADTPLTLAMNEDLSSREARIGGMFYMTVAQDVRIDGYVVIPRGTPAAGEVTWRTGKGAFGKSGKMTVELRYIDMPGRRLPIEGGLRQEGRGGGVASFATGVMAGVFAAAVVTGKHAVILRGQELQAHTREALTVPANQLIRRFRPVYARNDSLPVRQASFTPSAPTDLPRLQRLGVDNGLVAPVMIDHSLELRP